MSLSAWWAESGVRSSLIGVFSVDAPAGVEYSRLLSRILLVLWGFSVLFGNAFLTHLLALTPGLTLSKFQIWTFVTAGLYDNSWMVGLMNVLAFAIMAPILERSWGSFNFAKFVFITNLSVNVSLFFAMVFCYASTEYEPCLYRAVCGLSGVNAGFFVALKQKFGEKSCVPIRGVDALRWKHIPMLLGWVSLALWLTGSLGGKEAPLIFFGTCYSFIYLRFFMRDASTGVVGDLRPEFAFSTFYPDIGNLRALVDFSSTIIFSSLRAVGCFAEAVKTNASLPVHTEAADSNASAFGGIGIGAAPLPLLSSGSGGAVGSSDPTAERRRLLAIKAIDDKLRMLDAAEAAQPAGADDRFASLPFSPETTQLSGSDGGAHSTGASPEAQALASSALVAAALPSDEELAKMESELGQPSPSATQQQQQPAAL